LQEIVYEKFGRNMVGTMSTRAFESFKRIYTPPAYWRSCGPSVGARNLGS
jgi:hypothetical protein